MTSTKEKADNPATDQSALNKTKSKIKLLRCSFDYKDIIGGCVGRLLTFAIRLSERIKAACDSCVNASLKAKDDVNEWRRAR
jgi:hypothetical protein